MLPDLKVLDWLIGAITSLLGALYLVHNRRIDKLETDVANVQQALPNLREQEELTHQRRKTAENIERIFELIDEMKDRATERHLELVNKIEDKADRA